MKLKKRYSNVSHKVDIVIIVVIIILFLTFLRIKIFTKKSNSFLLSYAENESSKLVTAIINSSLNDLLKFDKQNIVKIVKSDTGEIISLELNDNEINRINYLLSESISKNIELLESGKFNDLNKEYISNSDLIYRVPIGVIYDFPILVELTPKIPIKTTIMGNIDSETNTNVKDYGINNFILEVNYKVTVNVQIILPFASERYTVSKIIPLDTKLIQGKIPNYYGGLVSNSKN